MINWLQCDVYETRMYCKVRYLQNLITKHAFEGIEEVEGGFGEGGREGGVDGVLGLGGWLVSWVGVIYIPVFVLLFWAGKGGGGG